MPSDVVAQTNFPPELDGTLETNQLFCKWVAAALGRGQLEPKVADSMISVAKAEGMNISRNHTLHEMDELRDLVQRAEAVAGFIKQREQQERRDASDGTQQQFGRVKVG